MLIGIHALTKALTLHKPHALHIAHEITCFQDMVGLTKPTLTFIQLTVHTSTWKFILKLNVSETRVLHDEFMWAYVWSFCCYGLERKEDTGRRRHYWIKSYTISANRAQQKNQPEKKENLSCFGFIGYIINVFFLENTNECCIRLHSLTHSVTVCQPLYTHTAKCGLWLLLLYLYLYIEYIEL